MREGQYSCCSYICCCDTSCWLVAVQYAHWTYYVYMELPVVLWYKTFQRQVGAAFHTECKCMGYSHVVCSTGMQHRASRPIYMQHRASRPI